MKNTINKNIFIRFNPFSSKSISPTLVIVYFLMAAFFAIKNPIFISLKNYQTIATNAPIIGIVALGLGMVLLTGNVDLSVGSTAGLVAVISALILRNTDFPIMVVLLIAILIGLVIGTINGLIVNYIGVNSIITTLGMWAALKGAAMIISGGTIYFSNKGFQLISKGFAFGIIPNVLIYFIIIIILMYLTLRYTKFGRNIYLVGANSISARAVGINVKRTKFLVFLLSSSFAAFAGILLVSQFAGAAYNYGTGWEFKALTICIVGGISLNGGRGTYVGLFLSLLIIGSLSNGLTMINMPIYWRDFFEGSILLLAIIIDSFRVKNFKEDT